MRTVPWEDNYEDSEHWPAGSPESSCRTDSGKDFFVDGLETSGQTVLSVARPSQASQQAPS